MVNTACRFILLLALTALVTACATSPEQQAKRDGERCAAGGRQPQSKAYEECLSRIASERDARLQQRHRELVERPPS
jgi:hypothetical protein